MTNHIDFNTEKRMNAANGFEKDYLKLIINSVYGKTLESWRKRINVRLVNKAEVFINILASQHTLLIKFLVKMMLLFMKLNQI